MHPALNSPSYNYAYPVSLIACTSGKRLTIGPTNLLGDLNRADSQLQATPVAARVILQVVFSKLSGRVGSGRVGSGRVGSGRVGSGRVGSRRTGSGRAGPGRFGSTLTLNPER